MPGTTGRVALIGAGRMGSALLGGWLRKARSGVPADRLLVIDPRPGADAQALIEAHPLQTADALTPEMAASASELIIAVKPAQVRAVLEPLAEDLPGDALILSIAAGVPLRAINAALPGRPTVRAMPNTPAAIGKGISVCVANAEADAKVHRQRAEKLLKAAGIVEWIEDERLMDTVTAVSGSGPAYIYLFCEALAAAAEAEGLPRDLALKLAVQTVAGAGAMLDADQGAPDALRRQVTSPGGTTQAGLDALMSGGGLPGLIRNAVAAAERRGRQLGAASRD